MSEQQLLNVGKIVNTHGVRGEIKVWPQTDFPDVRFRAGSKLLLVNPEAGGQPAEVEVVSAREQKNMFVVRLKGWDDINQVEKYKGWELKVEAEDRVELEEDEYYLSDIVGCAVFTEEGEELGFVKEILSPGANDVWVVKRLKGGDLLLPYIDEVVKEVDVAARRVKVHLMEGLL
ncbi:ribosome maturation factor RimM [Cohnella sp. GCM10012308]|uniref:ribosome maturation factor RimM n=1 Tax=Cohnella sp. GCM10012308 TaxID=3317329 RepID=UPI003619B9E0